MCDICLKSPCDPRCPNAPESDPVYDCGKLDAELQRIFGDGMFAPFKERYPYCKEWDYTKGSKKK